MILFEITSATWMVTGLGFGLVLVLLLVLVFIMKLFGKLMQPKAKKTQEVQTTATEPIMAVTSEEDGMTAETSAAIAMALHLYYNGVHDEEPTQITIRRIERKYSPWNAKLFGMNNLHRF